MTDLSQYDAHLISDAEHSQRMHALQRSGRMDDYMQEVGGTSRRTALANQADVLESFANFKRTLARVAPSVDPNVIAEAERAATIAKASREQLDA